MSAEIMKHYGLHKELNKAEFFETDDYKILLENVKFAARSGGIIALTGMVGTGKTVSLRHIQKSMLDDNNLLISKSLATDKRRVSISTLYTALFADLATKKDGKLPMQSEKRERKLQSMLKERNKPVVLFIDEAHDLNTRTLVELKHLLESVEDAQGILSVVMVGHPKLANDLRNPVLEEIGARAKLFELNSLGTNKATFITWVLDKCSQSKVKPHDIFTQEAIEELAERLITPLQMTAYMTRALEKAFQIGEKPVSQNTIKSILSPDLNTLEAVLARNGYSYNTLCEKLTAKRPEIKAYLSGQASPSRVEELNKEIHKLGVVI